MYTVGRTVAASRIIVSLSGVDLCKRCATFHVRALKSPLSAAAWKCDRP